MKKILLYIAIASVICTSFILSFHNVSLYQPKHGFDGVDHLFYIKYMYQHWHLPPVNLAWETHQAPLYYILGALLMSITKSWKTAEYLNTFVLWGVIGMTGVALWKVFKKQGAVLIGMFCLAALPMLNIFPPMITNELLGAFWMISVATACIYLIHAKNKTEYLQFSVWVSVSLILGYWTKVSIVILLPTVITAYLILFLTKKIKVRYFLSVAFICFIVVGALCAPLYIRSEAAKGPSNIGKVLTTKISPRPADFYYRLDWIPKVDMYTTQYYSLIGGAWNSFWNDGHNVVTPFIKFHKKAFILWTLGFVLFPVSLYGLLKLYKDKKHRSTAILLTVVGLSMLGFYVFYNMVSGHYSAARLTYEMAIVVPYSFGIAAAYRYNKWLKYLLVVLISVQFIIMTSFFWILDWWHVTLP
jgi:hypothetical protein